jgi:hypothetical protein
MHFFDTFLLAMLVICFVFFAANCEKNKISLFELHFFFQKKSGVQKVKN